ncbi:hypothetical protein RJ639_002788 [Escallonia herrerae]|uniref:Rho termination factor-like N-terminal domain-containing protein n=1 Tax=Escallonia herrerae TaxID=1293975 RepID=A0AA89AWY1_9ASTE|nr:hypothetical protein RJ639_002788 [Escallonia herrerae]
MEAIGVYYAHSVLHLPFLSAISKPKLGKPFSLNEIAYGPPSFSFQRDNLWSTTLSIRADGNRRGKSATERSQEDDGDKTPHLSDGNLSNSSNQDEILALFKRIQASISKGEGASSRNRNPKSSDENSSAESVLEVLRQSRKQVRASNKEGGKTSPRIRGLSKGEEIKEYSPVVDQKLSRPPSVFVKRSPIPSAPSQRAVELKSEASSVTANKELGAEELEEMKLPALKELAKSRGMKGYSKLKKGELVELLRS